MSDVTQHISTQVQEEVHKLGNALYAAGVKRIEETSVENLSTLAPNNIPGLKTLPKEEAQVTQSSTFR